MVMLEVPLLVLEVSKGVVLAVMGKGRLGFRMGLTFL